MPTANQINDVLRAIPIEGCENTVLAALLGAWLSREADPELIKDGFCSLVDLAVAADEEFRNAGGR